MERCRLDAKREMRLELRATPQRTCIRLRMVVARAFEWRERREKSVYARSRKHVQRGERHTKYAWGKQRRGEQRNADHQYLYFLHTHTYVSMYISIHRVKRIRSRLQQNRIPLEYIQTPNLNLFRKRAECRRLLRSYVHDLMMERLLDWLVRCDSNNTNGEEVLSDHFE